MKWQGDFALIQNAKGHLRKSFAEGFCGRGIGKR